MPMMPAARTGDLHVCPMVSPVVLPIPHVGGPIIPGRIDRLNRWFTCRYPRINVGVCWAARYCRDG